MFIVTKKMMMKLKLHSFREVIALTLLPLLSSSAPSISMIVDIIVFSNVLT